MKIIASHQSYQPGLPTCDNSKYLHLLSCGLYDLRNNDHTFLCSRPAGECQSYMLHILLSGQAYHTIAGHTHILHAGQCILYAPGAPQHIIHYGKDDPIYIWVHFCGFAADTIVKDLHLDGIHTLRHFSSSGLKKAFLQLIYEKNATIPNNDYLCLSHFLDFLCNLSLYIQDKSSNALFSNKIAPAIEHMTSHYASSELSNKDYAAMCFLSESRFSHIFKEVIGSTPQKFMESKRIEAAKELLLTSNLRISEIAGLVGYEDAYYFSRIFKKNVGLSPREFSKQHP